MNKEQKRMLLSLFAEWKNKQSPAITDKNIKDFLSSLPEEEKIKLSELPLNELISLQMFYTKEHNNLLRDWVGFKRLNYDNVVLEIRNRISNINFDK